LAQISNPIVFEPPYFYTAALYRKSKTNLSRIDRSSNSDIRWRNGYTPKGKTGKFLIYPPFQRSTPSTAPPMLYNFFGAVAAVKRLPCHISEFAQARFTGGISSPLV